MEGEAMEAAPEAISDVPDSSERDEREEKKQHGISDEAGEKETSGVQSQQRSRRKIKVDGEELEVDEDELVKGYQQSRASTKRFQEAARLRKEAEQYRTEAEKFKKALEDGDLKTLEKDFPELRKSTEKYLLEQLEYDQLPDHEKELRRLRAELNQERETKQQEQERLEKERYEQQLTEAETAIDKEISEALQQAKYKVSPQFIQVMIDQMKAPLLAMRDGQPAERMSGADAFKAADKWGGEFVGNYLESIPVEAAMERVPKAVLEHYRKQHLSRLTSNLPGRAKSDHKGTAPVRNKKQKVGIDEFFNNL